MAGRKQRRKTNSMRERLLSSFPPDLPPITLEGPIRMCVQNLVKLIATLEKKEALYRGFRLHANKWLRDLVALEL